MALAPWRTGIVFKIEQQAEHSSRFFIKVPELEAFDFKPGQFVTLDLPIHEKPHKRLRSYSIASWPDGSNTFELCIVQLPEGSGTNYLFNEVVVGTSIKFRGPVGVFTLPATIEKDIFLICTGTGVAPFRSMLHYIVNNNIPRKNIYLVFGTRRITNLLYYEELKDLAAHTVGIHYIPVLSREEWNGKRICACGI